MIGLFDRSTVSVYLQSGLAPKKNETTSPGLTPDLVVQTRLLAVAPNKEENETGYG